MPARCAGKLGESIRWVAYLDRGRGEKSSYDEDLGFVEHDEECNRPAIQE